MRWREGKKTYVKPPPKHPSPMLLQLQPLDINIGQHHAPHKKDRHEPNPRLHVQPAAVRPPGDHQRARDAGQRQHQDDIAVHPVEQEDPVPDGGHELEANQKTGGEDGGQVQTDADLLDAALREPVALTAPLVAGGRAEGSPVVELG